MKIEELMIGDWVLFRRKDKTRSFQVTQIRESAFDGKLDVWSKDGNMGCDCIEPIPLTNEIPEKNSFRYNYDRDEVWFEKGIIRAKVWKYEFFMLRTVHGLQHVLRLYGLEDLADNFNI